MGDYSTQELMIAACAREVKDHEVVFVGMRLPIIAFGVARLTHAPNAVGLFECGLMRHAPASDMLYTMGDPPNQKGAAWATGTMQVMGLLQRGDVNAGFIGGAEIDKLGNINTSYIGDFKNPKTKLPGSGGAADIASQSQRLIAIMNHEKRRLVEKVDYITSPGNKISALITDMAILRPYGEKRELHLFSLHPGHSLEEVRKHTGWNVAVHPQLGETLPPSKAELTALRQIDRDGFWR